MSCNLRQIVQAAGALFFVLNPQFAGAAEGSGTNETGGATLTENLFERGRYEAAFTSGVLFSPFGPTRMRPTINYTVTAVQLGYMVEDVKGDGWWRGDFEVAGEGFGSAIYDGPGGYIAGGILWLRYNFVPWSSSGLVPYAQAGGGFASTDVDHRIVGQPFNFNLDLGLGVRYFVARNWSLSLEYRYQHVSNADLNKHNLGINAGGPILGVSYFF